MPKRSSNKKQALAKVHPIEPVIRVIRGQRVILDSDLARIYGADTRSLVQAVKRNLERFPSDFMFQLNASENERLRSQFVISKRRGGRRYLPHAFTEHGAIMAANVLNSERAVAMSVFVVRAFVKLREVLASTDELAKKLDDLERKLTSRQNIHEKAILQLFAQIRGLLRPPPPQPEPKRRRIGF
ncbi:MAG TPA: ORF6N domain-containing protein [Pyrinomonadaceae bacterium]|nr:ORF6N domain-containing protein [Pyrinomonadaceae bacterium]